jgi:hypothetical protein
MTAYNGHASGGCVQRAATKNERVLASDGMGCEWKMSGRFAGQHIAPQRFYGKMLTPASSARLLLDSRGAPAVNYCVQ